MTFREVDDARCLLDFGLKQAIEMADLARFANVEVAICLGGLHVRADFADGTVNATALRNQLLLAADAVNRILACGYWATCSVAVWATETGYEAQIRGDDCDVQIRGDRVRVERGCTPIFEYWPGESRFVRLSECGPRLEDFWAAGLMRVDENGCLCPLTAPAAAFLERRQLVGECVVEPPQP